MSILLKKALKLSILPAVLMVAGKFVGVMALIVAYNLQFEVGNEITGVFSTQIFLSDEASTIFVNSLSDLAMLVVLGVPTLYMIVRTTILQSAKNNPRTIAKMVKFNVLKWVTSNTATFLKIFIWSTFVLIASIITVSNSLNGESYAWVGVVAGVLSLLSIWGLVKTFEIETDRVYPNNREHSYF
ncbi:MAG: hypothetical protein WCR68_00050 [Candidatus Dojkabacteria bacterium]|jgi:hypothetical protein|nr:hypothetical protein [Candidatus Dojkabacteria bacterium]